MPCYQIFHDHEFFQNPSLSPSKDIAEGILKLHADHPRSLAPSDCVQFAFISAHQLHQPATGGRPRSKPWIRVTAEIHPGLGDNFKQWLLSEVYMVVYNAIKIHDRRGIILQGTEIQVQGIEVDDRNLLMTDGVLGARSGSEARKLASEAVMQNGGYMPASIIQRSATLPPAYADIVSS